MVIFTVMIMAILSFIYYMQFRQALQERVFLQLQSVKQLKVSQILHRLESVHEDFWLSNHFIDKRKNIDGLVYHVLSSGDTTVGIYPVKIPSQLQDVKIIDLTTYDPNGLITLAFIQKNKSQFEIAIVQPDIQRILLERTGLGETGESYLVGEDKLMRSRSRFYPDQIPTEILVNTRGVNNALKGTKDHGIITDYRGVRVFSAYEKLVYKGLSFVILTEMDEQEALFPLESLRNNIMLVFVILVGVVFAFSYEMSGQLVKPVISTERKLNEMSKGIFSMNSPFERRGDEFGEMFLALEKLIGVMNQSVSFANEIGSGNFDAEYELLGPEDKLGAALIDMKERLQLYQQNEKKHKLENQRSLISGEEKERERLSKELHDGLGPMLTFLRIQVESSKLEEQERIKILGVLDEVIGEMRKISNNLMPSVLSDFGAGEAIRNLLGQFSSNLNIRYQYDENAEIEIPRDISIALYRVVQEAINNVLKHSDAKNLNISLTEFSDRVSLYIQDDGVGFDHDQRTSGNGLRNMRERVVVENGIFELNSSPRGTVIEVEIPLA